MRFKRSSALVVLLEHDQFVFHNYLVQSTFAANTAALDIVRRLYAWTNVEQLYESLKSYSRSSIERGLDQLVELAAVVVEGSPAAAKDAEFERSWLWGPFAGAFHFGTRGGVFVSDEDSETMLREQAKFSPSPPLHQRNPDDRAKVTVPLRPSYDEPFRTMTRRRTNRIMLDEPVAVEAVSDCFLFSMAITAMLDLPGIGELPLKMTPSGGARNPFEGYVCVRNVEGLDPGVYHYAAIDRSFALVREGAPPSFPSMLGEQTWTANAAAVVFLVANFDRSMWKYHDPMTYRVIAIEAGHIAQNMLLVATHHGLVGNPTGLINTLVTESALGVSGPTQAAIYAIALGVPAPFSGDLGAIAEAG
ncbi:MAG TPA: SagB family peptide dehydrogenase [Caulobacteraceae bacterium]|jgi:SagB-type dehydrogenase family enzyme